MDFARCSPGFRTSQLCAVPQQGYGDFVEEQRLSDAEITLISRWLEEETPQGPASEMAAPPRFPEGWALGEPDLVVEAEAGITVPATGPDVFWNFILSPQLKASRFVRAIEIRAGKVTWCITRIWSSTRRARRGAESHQQEPDSRAWI